MSYKIGAVELRKALAEIEAAEANGFMYCEAIFDPESVCGVFTMLRYSDMHEKAHPTNGDLDWGRFQGVTKRHRFADGKIQPLDSIRP